MLEAGLATHLSPTVTGRGRAPRAGTLPVKAAAVEQGLGVAVQGRAGVLLPVALLSFVQRHEEGRLLHGVQRLLVLPARKVGLAAPGPGHPVGRAREGA